MMIVVIRAGDDYDQNADNSSWMQLILHNP